MLLFSGQQSSIQIHWLFQAVRAVVFMELQWYYEREEKRHDYLRKLRRVLR